MQEGEQHNAPETKEKEPTFQYAEIRYGAPGHEWEYTMHVGDYDDKNYIPRGVDKKLEELLPNERISYRGSRIEISTNDRSDGKDRAVRKDTEVFVAVNKALAQFAQDMGQLPYKLGPYDFERAIDFVATQYGGEMAEQLLESAVYEVSERTGDAQAQNIYDLVEGFYQLVFAARYEDDGPLDGETVEERTERNKQNLAEVLDEIKFARGSTP